MDNTTEKYFQQVRSLFKNELDGFINQFAERVEVNIIDIAKRQRERFKDMQEQIKPSFSLNITLANKTHARKLTFILTDGTNIEDTHFNSLRCLVESTRKNAANFSIEDYFKARKLSFDADSIFIFESEQKALAKIKQYIDQMTILLEQEEVQQALFSKKWLDVPKDYSGYK